MSEIIKTDAIVLGKINFGDTSTIVTLYTENSGKLSAIVKGGRNPKSKMGLVVDLLNYLQVILYKKESRDVQLLSGAEIISYYPRMKEDLNSLKFAYAIIELVKNLSPDNEPHKKIFNGLVRILSLIDSFNEKPEILFGKFFLFFLSEIGYAIQLSKCSVCATHHFKTKMLGYNFERGLLCDNCKKDYLNNYDIYPELFDYLLCLNTNSLVKSIEVKTISDANNFFEMYLKYHIPDFKGIESLKSF